MLCIGVAYVGMVVLSLVTWATPPRLSIVVAISARGAASVASLQPSSILWDRGVRTGGRVLSLDGHIPQRRDVGPWSETRLVVRAGNAGAKQSTTLPVARMIRNDTPLLLLSPWFLLLGTLVLLRVPEPVMGGTAYALFASAALALAPASDGDVAVALPLEFTLVGIFAACFPRFFLIFPQKRGSLHLHALQPIRKVLVMVKWSDRRVTMFWARTPYTRLQTLCLGKRLGVMCAICFCPKQIVVSPVLSMNMLHSLYEPFSSGEQAFWLCKMLAPKNRSPCHHDLLLPPHLKDSCA